MVRFQHDMGVASLVTLVDWSRDLSCGNKGSAPMKREDRTCPKGIDELLNVQVIWS